MKTGASKPTTVCLLTLAMALAACSANTTTTTPAPAATGEPPAVEPAPADDPAAAAEYPEGPYGNAVGQVLPDFELVGYRRNEAKGLATSAGVAPVKIADIRAQAGDVKYALIHVSAFWCGICRAAVEDLVAEYPKVASKAIFVDLLVEGETPEDVATKANLDSWVKALTVPYSVARDPDGVQFRIRSKVGKNKTAILVELATMKIIAKSPADYSEVLEKLKSLP